MRVYVSVGLCTDRGSITNEPTLGRLSTLEGAFLEKNILCAQVLYQNRHYFSLFSCSCTAILMTNSDDQFAVPARDRSHMFLTLSVL